MVYCVCTLENRHKCCPKTAVHDSSAVLNISLRTKCGRLVYCFENAMIIYRHGVFSHDDEVIPQLHVDMYVLWMNVIETYGIVHLDHACDGLDNVFTVTDNKLWFDHQPIKPYRPFIMHSKHVAKCGSSYINISIFIALSMSSCCELLY